MRELANGNGGKSKPHEKISIDEVYYQQAYKNFCSYFGFHLLCCFTLCLDITYTLGIILDNKESTILNCKTAEYLWIFDGTRDLSTE